MNKIACGHGVKGACGGRPSSGAHPWQPYGQAVKVPSQWRRAAGLMMSACSSTFTRYGSGRPRLPTPPLHTILPKPVFASSTVPEPTVQGCLHAGDSLLAAATALLSETVLGVARLDGHACMQLLTAMAAAVEPGCVEPEAAHMGKAASSALAR